MKIRFCVPSPDTRPGVREFLVTSDSGGHYIVVHIDARQGSKRFRGPRGSRRGGWSCSCPDYQHRGQIDGLHCKHIKLIKGLAAYAGGMSHLPVNEEIEATLP